MNGPDTLSSGNTKALRESTLVEKLARADHVLDRIDAMLNGEVVSEEQAEPKINQKLEEKIDYLHGAIVSIIDRISSLEDRLRNSQRRL